MPLTIYTVDAFTRRPFAGNPAAVTVLPAWRDAAWLQAVAAEMNLSETAYLVLRGDGDWALRWFTPAVEVDLCGHATLASAHVLWETGLVDASHIVRFHTRSGVLSARRSGSNIEMDFPAKRVQPAEPPPDLMKALGAQSRWVGNNGMDYLVELASESAVRALAPDFSLLGRVECRGVIVTARADSTTEADFVSRFFAPRAGVLEDPVTGSAHCALAPYWRALLGKDEMVGLQVSKRSGIVAVRCAGERVILSGHAVTVLRADLLVEN